MGRRDSSSKILFALFSEENPSVRLGYAQLEQLTPEISAAGRRSLMSYLLSENLVVREQFGRQSYFRLGQMGSEAVKASFPPFSDHRQVWNGQWAIVSFVAAPVGDRQFRYVRQLLIQHQAVKLSRGDYLLPVPIAPSLLLELKNTYSQSVLVMAIEKTLIGDLRAKIFEELAIEPIATSLSGISSELTQLLHRRQAQRSLSDQQKKHIFSVFDRFWIAAKDGTGLEQFYFPQVNSWQNILSDLQSLME